MGIVIMSFLYVFSGVAVVGTIMSVAMNLAQKDLERSTGKSFDDPKGRTISQQLAEATEPEKKRYMIKGVILMVEGAVTLFIAGILPSLFSAKGAEAATETASGLAASLAAYAGIFTWLLTGAAIIGLIFGGSIVLRICCPFLNDILKSEGKDE